MAEHVTYQLEKSSDISKSEIIHEQMERFLTEASDIVIDASQVERIDTSALQILVALSRSLKNQHLSACIQNPSESFLSAAKLLGVVNELEIQNT